MLNIRPNYKFWILITASVEEITISLIRNNMAVSCPEVMYGAYYPYLYGRAGPSRSFYQYERVSFFYICIKKVMTMVKNIFCLFKIDQRNYHFSIKYCETYDRSQIGQFI